MTLSDLLTQNPELAQRQVDGWEIDGPCVRRDGNQMLRLVVRPPSTNSGASINKTDRGDE